MMTIHHWYQNQFPELEAVRARIAAKDPAEIAIQRPFLLNQLTDLEDSEYEFYSKPTTSFTNVLVRLYKSHTGIDFVPTAPSWPAELEEEADNEGGKELTEGTTIDTYNHSLTPTLLSTPNNCV